MRNLQNLHALIYLAPHPRQRINRHEARNVSQSVLFQPPRRDDTETDQERRIINELIIKHPRRSCSGGSPACDGTSDYFIFTPLKGFPLCAIWSMKRPVVAFTFVQRLLRDESTCARFFTVPFLPFPLGPFFAILSKHSS